MAATSSGPVPVGRSAAALNPGSLLTGAALLAVAAAAWAGLLVPSLAADPAMPGMGAPSGMGESPAQVGAASLAHDLLTHAAAAGAFVTSWIVMMTAMMLPSAVPMLVLHRAVSTGTVAAKAAGSAMLVGGYLLGWGAFGLGVYLLQRLAAALAQAQPSVSDAWAYAVAAVLVTAGLYQFSRLKEVCLRQCRSPLSFLMTRWQAGAVGSLRLGLHHALYCVGCCWGLMAVLVVAGAMGTAWVALIALVVFIEKLLPYGPVVTRVGGAILIATGAVVVMRPEVAAHLPM